MAEELKEDKNFNSYKNLGFLTKKAIQHNITIPHLIKTIIKFLTHSKILRYFCQKKDYFKLVKKKIRAYEKNMLFIK